MAAETLAVTLLMKADQYKREASQAATATGQIGQKATATGTATGKLDQQMSGLATTAKVAVAGAAAAAVVKFGKDSVQAFLGFDDAMNQSIAIMGDVSDSLRGEMEAAAREVGKTMRISAEEAAEAYFFLASAGLDAEQSVAAMPQVAKFAQAGMFDMATATDLATDAQSALGLSVDDAQQNLKNLTRVTDVFVKANVLANTSVQQVSEAMTNKAGAAMRALGIDVEEGTAVLAAFADQGVKGAEAGTQFSIVLRDLQTKAIDNKDAFEAAGIAVFDSQGEFRNFADVIGDLETRLSGMSDEQKRAELSMLGFSDKSIGALTTLLGTSEAIREYEKELRNAAGTTEEIADNQMESFQGQLDILKGRMEDVQITIGEVMVPALIDLADAAIPVVEVLGLIAQGYNDLRNASDRAIQSGSKNPIEVLAASFSSSAFQSGFTTLSQLWMIVTDFKHATDDLNMSMDDYLDVTEESIGAANRHRRSTVESTTATERAIDVIDEAGRETHEAADETMGYSRELRNLRDVQLQLVNPALAGINALIRYKDALDENDEALRKYGKGSDEANRAGLNLLESYSNLIAEAQIYAQVAGVSLNTAIRNLGTDAGLSEDQVQFLIDSLNELDGLTIDTLIQIRVKTSTITVGNVTLQPGEVAIQSDTRLFRASGGPVMAGQPYIVGEDGPELFVPDASGQIIPNGAMPGGMAAGSTTIVNQFTLARGDFMQELQKAGIDIQRLGW